MSQSFRWRTTGRLPTLLRETAGLQFVLHRPHQQAVCPSHQAPVVLVSGSTGQANLVMACLFIHPRPRETVRASLPKKQLQQFHDPT